MPPPTTASYGSWPSPISPATVAAGQVRLGEPRARGRATYWIESQPADGGQARIVRHTPDTGIQTLSAPGFDARTRVHEYGGGAYAVHGATLFFSNFADARLYRQDAGATPRALTPDPGAPSSVRYADICPTPDGRLLACVRERHGGGGAVSNELVLLRADGGARPSVLARGRDFYASPRVSPDGRWLAWIAWDHPNMPWDGTELMVGELSVDGRLLAARRVAGGPTESIFQPAWSPDGTLHFVSDRGGWWSLYRLGAAGAERLTAPGAEVGEPQWTFGQSSYAFVPGGIALVMRRGARQRLGLLPAGGGRVAELAVGRTSFDVPYLDAGGGRLVFIAGSPTLPEAVVSLDLASGRVETLRSGLTAEISASQISVPRAIEFPTTGGRTAHAYLYAPRNGRLTGRAGELPPAIVITHGGPTGQASTCLSPSVQLWTTRGYAVVDVDYRGSTGYGRAYREELRGLWGVADVEDCVNATRHLAGEIDTRRLAIRGASAGGYTTLCALTFTDVFAAGASYFGVGDLEALTRETHKFESHYLDALIGPYPERAALYRQRSPIHSVDRLRCPIILFQGMLDEVVPPAQAAAMSAALDAARIPHVHMCFADEAHGFRRAENIERALAAELRFYAEVFGCTPAGDAAAA